jgi:chromosome segregation ATPase
VFKKQLQPWQKVDEEQLTKLRACLAGMEDENQSTLLLKKEREDWEVQEKLRTTREKVADRLKECRQKKLIFERKQAELQDTVTKNEQFIRDTDAKIEKAEKKAREETLEMRKHEEELAQYNKLRDRLIEEKNAEMRVISQNSQYKKYLESVVAENEEEYEGEIENVLNRHQTLEQGNLELQAQDVQVNAELDKRREEFQRKVTELTNAQLMINSELHGHQMQLERLRAERAELENKLTSAIEEREMKESEIGIITMAIEQLYQRAQQSCRDDRRRNAMVEATESKFGHREDLVLKEVSERLVDLMWMVEQGKKEMKERQGNVQVLEDTNLRPSTPKFVMVHDEPGGPREPKSAGATSGAGTDSLTLSGAIR